MIVGHEPGYQRPAMIVSQDDLSRHGLPVVLPISRTRRGYPTHVELEQELPVVSYVQCEQIRVVSADRLIRPLSRAGDLALMRIDLILRRMLGL